MREQDELCFIQSLGDLGKCLCGLRIEKGLTGLKTSPLVSRPKGKEIVCFQEQMEGRDRIVFVVYEDT